MRGMVLAAGAGRRLRPYTDTLPKTLVPVTDTEAILNFTLQNFAAVGISEAVIVTGYAHQAIADRQRELEERYDLKLELVFNDKAEIWNNAYSLWTARAYFDQPTLLANGDTLHPVSVEQGLLAARGPGMVLALDTHKPLAEEEMKVQVSAEGNLTKISKLLDPATAAGEYIGLTVIEPAYAEVLADALERTFTTNPDLYYEDAYQLMANEGVAISTSAISAGTGWVEVDSLDDLAIAQQLAPALISGR